MGDTLTVQRLFLCYIVVEYVSPIYRPSINVSRKNRGLLYVYLTVEVFSQAIPDLFNPEIDFHPGSPSN